MNAKKSALEKEAVRWVRRPANKRLIIDKFASLQTHKSSDNPMLIFTAGSPGAGKTEFIKDFNKSIQQNLKINPVIIDPDAIRELLPGYTGSNSYLFQRAISIAVDDLFRHVIKNRLSAFVDGTLSAYSHAKNNITKGFEQHGIVMVCYVFQYPAIAWHFTQIRELVEGRNIRKKDFIEKFLDSKSTVQKVKSDFGDKVVLNVILKDYKDSKENKAVARVFSDVDDIEKCIDFNYTKSNIERILQDESN